MPLGLGQASGGWTESSSALRLLYAGIRNSLSLLTSDSFSQSNPPAVTTNVSSKVDTTLHGVLSGSVAFARPDAGSDYIGGPGSAAVQTAIQGNVAQAIGYSVFGVFENSAAGNAYENTPGVASGRGPHMTQMGTYGNRLYETALIGDSVGGDPAAGAAITYVMGIGLIASRNGYLTAKQQLNAAGAAIISCDDVTISAEGFCRNADNISTLIGVVKMVPDATQTELVYDQRI
jgi:hypothetical protein